MFKSDLTSEILRCLKFHRRALSENVAAVETSAMYKELKADLGRKFLLFAEMVADQYEGWKADTDNVGYLVRKSEFNYVRFPYYLAAVAPLLKDIDSIWALSRLIKTNEFSIICLSGSAVSRSAIVNFSDLDFCEYVFCGTEQEVLLNALGEKALDVVGRYLIKARIGDNRYERGNLVDIIDHAGPIDPAREEYATAKFDYIVDLEAASKVDNVRICEVSNLIIFCDASRASVGKKLTFAHQEAVLDDAINAPSDLTDPIAIGRYVEWLLAATKKELDGGRLQKACKRALSLCRVCHLGPFSNKIHLLASSCFAFVDSEIAAGIQLREILLQEGKAAEADRLQVSINLLENDKERIRIKNSGRLVDFEVEARLLLTDILNTVEERLTGIREVAA